MFAHEEDGNARIICSANRIYSVGATRRFVTLENCSHDNNIRVAAVVDDIRTCCCTRSLRIKKKINSKTRKKCVVFVVFEKTITHNIATKTNGVPREDDRSFDEFTSKTIITLLTN